MRRFRPILGFLIWGILGLVAVLAWRTLDAPHGKKPPAREPAISADVKLDRVHYTETRKGVKEWELEAASALYFKEEGTVILNHVTATFFAPGGQTYKLQAQKGKYHTLTKSIEVAEDVRIDSSEGYRLRTQSLQYFTERKELRTPDPVELEGRDLRVEGTGLVVEVDHQRVRILRNVTTTLLQVPAKPSLRAAM